MIWSNLWLNYWKKKQIKYFVKIEVDWDHKFSMYFFFRSAIVGQEKFRKANEMLESQVL